MTPRYHTISLSTSQDSPLSQTISYTTQTQDSPPPQTVLLNTSPRPSSSQTTSYTTQAQDSPPPQTISYIAQPKILLRHRQSLLTTSPRRLRHRQPLTQHKPKILLHHRQSLTQHKPKILLRHRQSLTQHKPKNLVHYRQSLLNTSPQLSSVTDNLLHNTSARFSFTSENFLRDKNLQLSSVTDNLLSRNSPQPQKASYATKPSPITRNAANMCWYKWVHYTECMHTVLEPESPVSCSWYQKTRYACRHGERREKIQRQDIVRDKCGDCVPSEVRVARKRAAHLEWSGLLNQAEPSGKKEEAHKPHTDPVEEGC